MAHHIYKDYSGNWRDSEHSQIYRRYNCAMEWWVDQAELEMATNRSTGSSSVRYPVHMTMVHERSRRTFTAVVSHSSGGLQASSEHVNRRVCAQCNQRFGRSLRACSRCLVVYYCSRDCQRAAWPEHRNVCVSPADRARQVRRTQDL